MIAPLNGELKERTVAVPLSSTFEYNSGRKVSSITPQS
jgi:hypothetical protein